MASKIKKKTGTKTEEFQYFFLNPYTEYAFSRCPKCETLTKLRKIPLVINVEPHTLLVLNKHCRYCTRCDLIIAKQEEIETFLANILAERAPEVIGNDYIVFGTVDRKAWRESQKREIPSSEFIDWVRLFKDHLQFEVIPGGWYPDDRKR